MKLDSIVCWDLRQALSWKKRLFSRKGRQLIRSIQLSDGTEHALTVSEITRKDETVIMALNLVMLHKIYMACLYSM